MKRWLTVVRNDPMAVAVRVVAGRGGLAWLYAKRNMLVDLGHINKPSLASTLSVEEQRIDDLILELTRSGLFQRFYEFAKERAFVDNYWCAMPGAPALYAITRVLRPVTVVETGVWWGLSSACVLQAMQENRVGRLISIDIEEGSGGAIPDQLRNRWRLLVGPSSQRLLPLLQSIGGIDMFIHDSDHSYENMSWNSRPHGNL